MSTFELPLSELTLRAFADNASDSLILHDQNGFIVEVNRRACEMTQYTREEMIGTHAADHDVTATFGSMLAVREKLDLLQNVEFEAVHKRRDGTSFPVAVTLRPFRTDQGRFCVAIMSDLTAEKESQSALERQAQMLMGAQKLTGLGCFDWNIETNEVLWSETLYEIYGQSPETFVVTLESFLHQVHPADRERVGRVIQAAIRDCGEYKVEERILRPDGQIRHLESRGVTICDASGKPTRVVGACLDITQRRAVEEKVRETQKMEAVGRLAGGVAHDFNNLLTVINGSAQLALENTPKQDGNHELLQAVMEAGQRAAELTSQLLAFSRGKNGEPQVVGLAKLLRSSMVFLERLAGEGISVALQLADEPLYISVDASQFEQVLINLVLNSRDAMPEGGQIFLTTERAGDLAVVVLRDTGCGIPEEQRMRIFDPFYTTKPTGKGTGLGLSIVYGIVSRSGGTVEVRSKVGEGSEFRLSFPTVQPPKIHEPASGPSTSTVKPQTKTVLIAEDNEAVRGVCVRVLKREGYKVLEAVNGREALRFLTEPGVAIDLLLTDLIMPEMDGAQLAREASALDPSLPIAYMSGYFEEATLLKGFTQDPRTFLQKPFTPAALLQKVNDLFEGAIT